MNNVKHENDAKDKNNAKDKINAKDEHNPKKELWKNAKSCKSADVSAADQMKCIAMNLLETHLKRSITTFTS